MAEPEPGGFSLVVMFAGQAPIVGGSLSLTVTVKVHVESGGLPFDAVHVTVVVPFGNAEPEAGLQVTVGTGQPLAVGVV